MNNFISSSNNKDWQNVTEVWACWERPRAEPDDKVACISFLRPSEEEDVKKQFRRNFISAREIAVRVKAESLVMYKSLIADIGIAHRGRRGSLRSSLKDKEGLSLWWFNKVSEKDCESDDTFRCITEMLIVRTVADSLGCRNLVFFGAYTELADSLNGFYHIKKVRCRRRYGFNYLVKGALSRLKYLCLFLKKWYSVKSFIKNLPSVAFDIVFAGFWDWSVKEDKETGRLDNIYFKSLPDKLDAKGYRTGWFLWFDPEANPSRERRAMREIFEAVPRHKNMVILQSFLTFSDIMKAMLNFKPLFIFLQYLNDKKFISVFQRENVNLLSLMKWPLVVGFMNSTLPHLELVRHAAKEACAKYMPKASVSFLELFLYSRAFYSGLKSGNANIINCAIQHASYSREKTFALLDAEIEFKGTPDGCPIPRPDYIYAMGEVGKSIFRESGFAEESIILTGSSRYEGLNAEDILRTIKKRDHKNVLIVTTLGVDIDIEMIEATLAASADIAGIRLFMRCHPFAKINRYPDFRKYIDRITLTDQTLEEDLRMADLIIFSYSTVAEEALVKGIPVWQWRSTYYNASIFRDLSVVPSFSSAEELRRSLEKFMSSPESFIPDNKTKELVLKNAFYSGDGKSSERIADNMSTLIGR